MTAETLRIARRLRRDDAYMTATNAILLARWRATAPTMDDGETWEVAGFSLRVSVTPDDWPYDGDDVPSFTKHASAETVSVRGYMWADDDYAETPLYPRTERIANYRARGASRDVARELAVRDMLREIRESRESQSSTYVVTVTASRESITLGSASLGGVTFGDDYGDSLRYIAETARELETEALADATDTLGRLCTSAADNG